MSLKECKSCKAQISKAAEKCPQCGAPQNLILNILISIFLLLIFAYFSRDIFEFIFNVSNIRNTPT